MEKKGWVLVDPGSAAGLDGSMAKAVERGENWFGYYWSPTSLIGKVQHGYQLILEFLSQAVQTGMAVSLSRTGLCSNPKPSSWTHSVVNTVITDRFKKAGGPAADYFSKRVYPGPVMNGMLGLYGR